MKITAILGSPSQKGTTSTIAKEFIQQAKSLGAETTTYFLNGMEFKGCQGCHICKTKRDDCVLQDNLTPALNDLKASDIVVLATPVYYWDVTGQFKSFFDRTWSLVKPDYKTNPDPVRLEKGKKAVFITSQGDIEKKHKDVSERYAGFLSMYGFETATIRAFDMGIQGEGDIAPYIRTANQLANQMIS